MTSRKFFIFFFISIIYNLNFIKYFNLFFVSICLIVLCEKLPGSEPLCLKRPLL